MVDFSDRNGIRHWLDRIEPAERRREVAIALAARAALRVIPLLGPTNGTSGQAGVIPNILLTSVPATALAWATGQYPARSKELQSSAAAAGARASAAAAAASSVAAGHNSAAAASATAYAATAVTSASDAATSAYASTSASARAVAYASAAAASHSGRASASVVVADADFIDSGGSGVGLAGLPLWPKPAPKWATEAWQNLKTALLAANEGWEVWTDWYEARLAGDAAHPPIEALEIARATIADEIWKKGPSVVNAEIKQLVEEHDWAKKLPWRPRSAEPNAPFSAPVQILPSIESIPEQDRTGTRFGMDAQGRIDVLRSPPATDELQRLHYDEMRHKAQTLAGLGQMLGDTAPAINRIIEALPEKIEDASVDRLWSRANTLRRRHDAHVRTVDNNLGPDPARLHPLVAASLGDFIDSFNVFVIGDPRGLELDRIRLGPQDREAARKIVTLAAPIASAVTEPQSPTTPAAEETLTEQVGAAIDAPDDINGDQAAELARKTAGNFVSELLRRAYAPIHKLGAAEARFAPKEIRAGFYRATGAAAFGGVAVEYWPEISSFVVRNADALKAFVATAYQNPKLVEIIDLIVKTTGH